LNAADPVLPVALPGAAGQLLEAARRALRQPAECIALVLRLSQLRPPAPLAHHVRIIRALLDDAAQAVQGQVFALRNGDLVLLCRLPSAPQEAGRAAERLLDITATLARLLRDEAADPDAVIAVWPLRTDLQHLLRYAADRAIERATPAAVPAPDAAAATTPLAVAALAEAAKAWTTQAPGEMLRLHSAIRLAPPRGLALAFQEVSVAVGALERRSQARAGGDAALLHHLATELDRLVLEVLLGALGGGTPLDLTRPGPKLHLKLTLAGVVVPDFGRLAAAACRPLAVEVSLAGSCAEPDRLTEAQAVLARRGIGLVLDQIACQALLLARPWMLGAAALKLDWSPRLGELPAAQAAALDEALAAAGPERIILHRADTEAALRWGIGRGITCFQGRHVDAMLAASRMLRCPCAAACTLAQCADRAAAATPAGQAGCRVPDRLAAA
jgi:hypothetical protein